MSFSRTDKPLRRIGLLADSHGRLAAIVNGAACLKLYRADAVIHLGDIFDSVRNDSLDQIHEAVCRHQFISIKGNNDYQIETLLSAGQAFGLPPNLQQQILLFLRQMPLRLEDGDICFAHSLPFGGIRSFYEPIDTGSMKRAVQVFNKTTYHILFCGHSHTGVLFRRRREQVTREPVDPDEIIHFQPSERYIVIVGAADKGECGIFDRDTMTYQRIRISSQP